MLGGRGWVSTALNLNRWRDHPPPITSLPGALRGKGRSQREKGTRPFRGHGHSAWAFFRDAPAPGRRGRHTEQSPPRLPQSHGYHVPLLPFPKTLSYH